MGRHPTTISRVSRVLVVLASAILALTTATGVARADDALAVLGIDAQEIGDSIGAQLTDALRKRGGELAGLRLVPGKDLIEMEMVFGCDSEAPACIGQAARSLGADKLVYGTLKKGEGGRVIVVSLKALDARDLTITKSISETVLKRAFVGPAINAAATRWIAQLVAIPQVGGIFVQSTPSGAGVLVDDAPVGKTPARVRDLRPGPHSVVVELDGWQPQTRTVDVHVGTIETVVARLDREVRVEAPKPPATLFVEPPVTPVQDAPPQKPRKPGRPAQYAAIGLGAGAIVSAAVAIYTWRHYVGLEHDAHSDLTTLATPAASNDLRKFLQHPTCTQPPAGSAAAGSYLSHCSSGQKFANATTGLWVSAGVLATAGIVSLIVGERLNANASKDQTSGQRLSQSLRLVPAVGTTGGGLQASFEF